jgi:hypothetical protein
MANQAKNPVNGNFEETAQKVVEYNEKVVEISKRLTDSAIDSYEKAALSAADLQEKVAGATPIEWVSSVASAQAGLTRELTKAYTKAARELLAA